MKHLTLLSLFSLLSDPIESKHYQENLEKAYEEFINEILNFETKADDIQNVIRKLNFARIEFIILRGFKLCGKGKKC